MPWQFERQRSSSSWGRIRTATGTIRVATSSARCRESSTDKAICVAAKHANANGLRERANLESIAAQLKLYWDICGHSHILWKYRKRIWVSMFPSNFEQNYYYHIWVNVLDHCYQDWIRNVEIIMMKLKYSCWMSSYSPHFNLNSVLKMQNERAMRFGCCIVPVSETCWSIIAVVARWNMTLIKCFLYLWLIDWKLCYRSHVWTLFLRRNQPILNWRIICTINWKHGWYLSCYTPTHIRMTVNQREWQSFCE